MSKQLSMTENARYKRARKTLQQNGYELYKSRGYRIVTVATSDVAWGLKYELDIDVVEAIVEHVLRGEPEEDYADHPSRQQEAA